VTIRKGPEGESDPESLVSTFTTNEKDGQAARPDCSTKSSPYGFPDFSLANLTLAASCFLAARFTSDLVNFGRNGLVPLLQRAFPVGGREFQASRFLTEIAR
jgi:hypothetical protein